MVKEWLVTIHMSKPVSSQFRQIIVNKTVPFTEKQLQKSETSVKDRFEEKEVKFLPATFNLENETTFSNIPFVLENVFLNSHPESYAH